MPFGSVEQGVIGLVLNQQNINGSEHPFPDSRSIQVASCSQMVRSHGGMERRQRSLKDVCCFSAQASLAATA